MHKKLLRLFAILAATTLLATPAFAEESKTLNAQEKAALNNFIKVLKDKNTALDSLLRMNFAVDDALVAAVSQRLGKDKDLPAMGSKGKTIIEFSDYRCGYCRRVFSDLEDLAAQGKIKINIVEFPVLGVDSETAARYAIAAWQLGKYENFHRRMMRYSGDFSTESLDAVAAESGINPAALQKHINSAQTTQLIEDNYRIALLLGIRGTPAFIIDGKLIRGAPKRARLLSLLKK